MNYIILDKEFLESVVWCTLTPHSKAVFISMLTEYQHDRINNPKFEVRATHQQISENSAVSIAQVSRCMKELCGSGVIKVVGKGVYRLQPSFTTKLNVTIW